MSLLPLTLALFLLNFSVLAAASAGHEDSQPARTLRTDALPRGMDGQHLTASLVEVHYRPGETSPPHTHPCPVVGYVLEGSIRSKVMGQAEVIYKPGDSFYEPPGGLHLISANAGHDAPARFLAFFVCDHDAPLSSAAPGSPSGEKP